LCHNWAVNKRNASKILLIVAGVLLGLQLPWFFVIQAIVDKTQTKTTATVIRIDRKLANCTGDSPGSPDPTCDHSDIRFPVYEYFDSTGKRYEKSDEYLGEYKENNPLWKVFGKEVGEKVTAYYDKGKPEGAVFMAGPGAYTAWLIPLYLTFPVLIASGLLFFLSREEIK